MVRAMCGVQLKDRIRSMDLIFMLGLNETMDQLAMANSVQWHGHVLRREDYHVLRRAIDFEVRGQRKNGRTWKKAGCGRKCEGWFEKGRCTLPIKVDCRRKQDYCWVGVNLAMLICWGYY